MPGWAGRYMADAGNGTVTENPTGDNWIVTASGAGNYFTEASPIRM
jgi:hypothetical protein